MTKKIDITNIDHWITDQKTKYPHGVGGINFKRLKRIIKKQYEDKNISETEKNSIILTLQMCEICYDKHKLDKQYRSILRDIEKINATLNRKCNDPK